MEYVMVPVPEELVDRVRTYLSWNAGKRDEGSWDRDRIAAVHAALDDTARQVLVLIAYATLDGEELTIDRICERTGLDVRATLGTLLEVNDLGREDNGPPFMVLPRKATVPTPEGGERQTYVVNMAVDMARLVLHAHGVDLADV